MPQSKSRIDKRAANDATASDPFRCFGSPRQVLADHEMFGKSVALFRSKDVVDQLRKQYADKWVGVYDGEVVLSADTLDQLLTLMDQNNVPRHTSYVKRITQNPIAMIL